MPNPEESRYEIDESTNRTIKEMFSKGLIKKLNEEDAVLNMFSSISYEQNGETVVEMFPEKIKKPTESIIDSVTDDTIIEKSIQEYNYEKMNNRIQVEDLMPNSKYIINECAI